MVVMPEAEFREKCVATSTAPSAAVPADLKLGCLERPSSMSANTTVPTSSERFNTIIENLAPIHRSRAKRLYSWLKELHPHIYWNDSGEVTMEGNERITGSNIVDLVTRAVDAVTRRSSPVGWDRFLTFLRRYNVPRTFLHAKLEGRMRLEQQQQQQGKKPAEEKEEEEEKIPSLPEKRKRKASTPVRSPVKLRSSRKQIRFEALPK